MSKTFCLLDDSMTLHGLRFKPEGGNMKRFIANPILLYMHKRGEVHGKWINVRLDAGKWLAEPQFDIVDPQSAHIAGKVERGFLNACSMGVNPIRVEMIGEEPWVMEWETIETSIVDAGSNGNALRLCGPDGEMIEDIEGHILNLTSPFMNTIPKPVTPVTSPAPGEPGATAPVVAPVELALAAGLAEGATLDLVLLAVKQISEKNAKYELEAQQLKKSELDSLLKQAVVEGKIKASEQANYVALAGPNLENLENLKTVIGNMAKPVDLTLFAKDGAQGVMVIGDENEALAAEYDKLDKSGALVSLQAGNPDKFKKLFKARWNADFTE